MAAAGSSAALLTLCLHKQHRIYFTSFKPLIVICFNIPDHYPC